MIERIIKEYDELLERLIKLEKFISKQNDEFMISKAGELAVKQKLIMYEYKEILKLRLIDLTCGEVEIVE